MKRMSWPPVWRYVAVGLVVSMAGAAGVVNLASAHPRSEAPMPAGPGRGMGPFMPGMGLPLGGPMLDRMLDDVKATDSQRERLHQIAEAARADLESTGAAARTDHARLVELFAQPTVDAAALEALRQQMLARHDQVTRRLNVAMLDAAQVLTPEQRRQFAEQVRLHEQRRPERRLERGPHAAASGVAR
jgi:Spy/CpxP family protein refolding chaperone